MSYTVTYEENIKVNISPETLAQEVLQNVSMILSTVKYSVPLYRKFGLSSEFLDKPTTVAEAILVSELLDAIEEFEPRVEVLDVSFERDEKIGKIIPKLEVEIIGE